MLSTVSRIDRLSSYLVPYASSMKSISNLKACIRGTLLFLLLLMTKSPSFLMDFKLSIVAATDGGMSKEVVVIKSKHIVMLSLVTVSP